MTQQKPKRWTPLDLAEGLQLAHAAAALHELGLLAAMKKPATVVTLGRAHRVDPEMLRGVLEYLAARTDLVRKTRSGYSASKQYTGEARFLLDLYTGAYVGNASQLATLLRKPELAAAAVDRVAHARAFDTAAASSVGPLPAILRQLGFNHVLDLGCGSAAMLRDLAANDENFIGWGLDFNPAMCKVARAHIHNAGLARRIKVFEGDGRNPRSSLPADVRTKVRTVTACEFANEMFRGGTSQAENWLRRIRRLFPGRTLVVSDYYGRLGQGVKTTRRETLLHDYAQIISGQGVPPPNARAWHDIYRAAGCLLLHVIEDRSTTRFIHLVKL